MKNDWAFGNGHPWLAKWAISFAILFSYSICFGQLIGERQYQVDTPANAENPNGLGQIIPVYAQVPIKIGVIISHYTATGPSRIGQPYGIGHANVANNFIQEIYDVYAVIEPDSINEPEIVQVLRNLNLSNKCINGYDYKELRKLDVIVSGFNSNLRDQMLKAIDQAVQRGTGLCNIITFGTANPGYTKDVEKLLGIPNGKYLWHPQPAKCRVLAETPLLPGYKKGDIVELSGINGWVGMPVGTPLLENVTSLKNHYGGPDGDHTYPAESVYPLYYRKHGLGYVVSYLNWGDLTTVDPKLVAADPLGNILRWMAAKARDGE